MKNIEKENDNCIGCGLKNPIGLKLDFKTENGVTSTRGIIKELYEGYKGIVHGGMVTLILDETAAKAILSRDLVAVTARISVSFIKPLYVNKEFSSNASITKIEGRKIFVSSEIKCDNELISRAESIFIEVKNG